MSPILADAEFGPIREALEVFLVHTYTRTPITSGAEDAHGNVSSVEGTPVVGVPCKYELHAGGSIRLLAQLLNEVEGSTTVAAPLLTVAWDDPLTVGDRVSNVTDQTGVEIAAGPLVVETIDPVADLGASVQRIAQLKGGTVRR